MTLRERGEGIIRHLMYLPVLGALLLTLGGCLSQRVVTVPLPDGARVAMGLRPMAGWHSDWYRSLKITHGETSVSRELFEDTGWWDGSNLYLHRSGAWVLNEGQAGCQVFTTTPPAFPTGTGITCAKARAPLAASAPSGAGYPPSRYYPDLFYVGTFSEPRRGETNPVFRSHLMREEPEPKDEL